MPKLFRLNLLLIITCAVSLGVLSAQTTLIPDARFEELLIQLGLDEASDGEVLTASIDTVISLVIRGDQLDNNIKDLTGIEAFFALKELDCRDNFLTQLDVSKNLNLEYLNTAGNQELASLIVSDSTNLIYLDCAQNFLNAIPTAQMPFLEILYCSNNQFSELDLTTNRSLDTLDASFNFIDSLIIADNAELSFLDVSGNAISNLAIDHMQNLVYLDCSSNKLSELDVTNNELLTFLHCSKNKLQDLDISNNVQLINLNCGTNDLASIDLQVNAQLKYLNCQQNKITALELSKNPLLEILWCQQNELLELMLEFNAALKELNSSNNHLQVLSVNDQPNLLKLQCSRNQLSELLLENNLMLDELACGGNKIGHLDLSQNMALTKVNCNVNNLTCLNIKNGNNTSIVDFFAFGNPNLSCIQVDDPSYSSMKWSGIDSTSSYSQDCGYLSCTTRNNFLVDSRELKIYPNPSSGYIYFETDLDIANGVVYIHNYLGQQVGQRRLTDDSMKMDLPLPNGLYYLMLESANKKFRPKRLFISK